MFEKQKQETSEGAMALQAGNDILITQNVGLTFTEVKEIFHLLLTDNFPKLREIAAQTATQNIENYLVRLETKFIENFDKIDSEKIKDPDVQYSFNEVVEASARKGQNIDSDILSELIIERISKNTTDLISIVSSEAIKILPKLTSQHIAYVTLLHYLNSVRHPNYTNISQFEPIAAKILNLTSTGCNLSESNKEYLQYAGIMTRVGISEDNYLVFIKQSYSFLNSYSDEDLSMILKKDAPSFYTLSELYKSNLYGEVLTAVGKMIAIANLKRIYPTLNYSIWIK